MPICLERSKQCSSCASWSRKTPRQGLQISQGHAIAYGSILVRRIGLRKRGLRVHDFQYRSFTTLVAERGETEALRRQFGRTAEAAEFVQGRFRFGILGLDFGNQLALRKGKLPLGLCAPQLCLLDAALRGAPVPDGNIQSGGSGRTQIGNSIRTVHGKLRCVDSVPIVEAQTRQIPAPPPTYLVTRP